MGKLLFLSALFFGLAGCDKGGQVVSEGLPTWVYRDVIDTSDGTRKKYRFANLESISSSMQDQEIGRYRVLLSIYKELGKEGPDTYSTIFGIDGGDLKCPDDQCQVRIRFDDEEKNVIVPKKSSARFFYIDGDSKRGQAFIRSILNSKKMVIGIDLELVGYRVFEFNIEDLKL